MNEDFPDPPPREDPDFAVTLAKARAKARGEVYNPEIHGPKQPEPFVPRRKRREAIEAEKMRMQADYDRIMAKAAAEVAARDELARRRNAKLPAEDWTTRRRDLE